ncbi:ABC transporter related protein [Oscillochloris trichoides DG-6]|uniref:ABC transporter related protein n=1 Tax=Oscillochloris trichoides DG-6 TaxID=765420 RepID=E1IEZ1_9CHLR|nr:ABC transporter ATP-binding protein [Oscillochloris trichoides]EFO80236.1 ABC transporter related protein [Oscillochloris trichoides DG-6]
MTPAIVTESLSKRYASRMAVENLSIQVQRGEVFGLLGPNGAGKTTTIAMLLGLVAPTSGHAALLGTPLGPQLAVALRKVGVMIETPAIYPYLNGAENLLVLARAGRIDPQRVDRVLQIVGLQERAKEAARTYSQGMRQRLAIAAALLPDPELIILDEPTNGLDPAGMVEIRDLIRHLAAEGRTILLCSHVLHEVEQLCQRVAILKEGRLIAQGNVADLLQREQGIRLRVEGDPAAAIALLHALPWVTGLTQEGTVIFVDAPSQRVAELNTYLARNDIAVAEIGLRERSLETFFLEVTGDR